jgi:hypothetical protein
MTVGSSTGNTGSNGANTSTGNIDTAIDVLRFIRNCAVIADGRGVAFNAAIVAAQ